MEKKVDGEVAELVAGDQIIHLFSCCIGDLIACCPDESRGVTHPQHIDVLPCALPAGNYL